MDKLESIIAGINLKKITLLGFKSFPDKTELDFNANYTGIVGPNGCGKSNIVDAIRWVLGEAGTNILRVKKSTELIFAGSVSKKSFSYCEVSIHLNNTPKKYPIDIDEVIITRKLDRSGVSDFFINSKKCRRQDIISLFRDSGIGKDGYSIIGQGQINKILDGNSKSRRAIFEEAAGIALQRDRKTKTEAKLDKARDDIARLNDIILEIEKQLTPLKKDANNARIVKDLKKRLKILEVFQFVDRASSSATEKSKIQVVIDKLTKDQNEAYALSQRLSKEYNESNIDRENIDTYQKKLNQEILNLSIAAEKAAGNKNVLQVKIAGIKNDISESDNIIQKQKESINNNVLELSNEKINLSKLSAKHISLEKEFVEINEVYKTKKQLVSDFELAYEEANKMLIVGINEKSAINKDMAEFQLEKKLLISGLTGDSSKFEEKNSKMKSLKDSIVEIDKKIQIKTEEKGKHFNQRINFDIELKKLREDQLALLEKIDAIKTEKSYCEMSIASVNEMLKKYRFYDDSIQTIMEEANSNSEFKKLFYGTVGSLIKVSKDLQLAIEISLGNSIQNIITDSEENAVTIINFLRSSKAGRATFLPISSIRGQYLKDEFLKVLDEDGVIGIAADLITYSSQFKEIIFNLLGRTVIVENKDCALRISKKYRNSIKLVTLDGDIFHPGGAITGGSTSGATRNILSQETLLIENEKKYQKADNNLKLALQIKEDNNQNITEYTNSISVVDARIVQIDKDIALLESDKDHFNKDLESIALEINSIVKANEDSYKRINELDELIATHSGKLNVLDNVQTTPEEFLNEKRNNLFEAREELDNFQNFYSQKSSEIQLLTNNINSTNLKINQIETYIKMSEKAIEEQQHKLESNTQELKNIEGNIDSSTFSEEDKLLLESLQNDLKKAEAYKAELDIKIKDLNENKSIVSDNLMQISEKLIRQESALNKIESNLMDMTERIQMNYDYDYSKAKEYLAENVPEEVVNSINPKDINDELKQINSKIDKIGIINELADEQYEETLARYDDMQNQYSDLDKAEKDMVSLLKKLTLEMQEKFSTNFGIINKNFQTMFTGIFGGGKAYLKLEENVDVLDADIEIMAQLPGSKLTSLVSLSGGERGLTAIAILFAIINTNPMPFCVLDEIDSALDDSNANLLGQYLKKFSSNTQFVIITHRKPTMEQCDILYGITSHEKGISQKVKVSLEEAVELSKKDVQY